MAAHAHGASNGVEWGPEYVYSNGKLNHLWMLIMSYLEYVLIIVARYRLYGAPRAIHAATKPLLTILGTFAVRNVWWICKLDAYE